MTQSMETVPSRLERLGKVAKQDKHLQFNNLLKIKDSDPFDSDSIRNNLLKIKDSDPFDSCII